MALWVGWGLLLLAILVGGGIRRMGDIFVSPLQGSGSRGREERALMVAEGVRQDWPGTEGTWGEGPQAVQRWGGLTTGRVERAALGGGHPEVGRASVKDDFEGLGWGANANLAIVLGLWG